MTATTQDRINTAYRDGELFAVPVAAGVVIPAGTIVCANAGGYAVPGAATAGLVYLGRADQRIDNSNGVNGASSIIVRRGKAFYWDNDAGDAVTQASVGRECFIADNQTVSKGNGGGSRPRAGLVLLVETGGVFVI